MRELNEDYRKVFRAWSDTFARTRGLFSREDAQGSGAGHERARGAGFFLKRARQE